MAVRTFLVYNAERGWVESEDEGDAVIYPTQSKAEDKAKELAALYPGDEIQVFGIVSMTKAEVCEPVTIRSDK